MAQVKKLSTVGLVALAMIGAAAAWELHSFDALSIEMEDAVEHELEGSKASTSIDSGSQLRDPRTPETETQQQTDRKLVAPLLRGIEFIVLDPDKQGIVGARIQIDYDGQRQEGKTDGDGKLRLLIPKVGEARMDVLVEAATYHHSRQDYVFRSQVRVTLDPLAEMSGTVRDKLTGMPIVGARVLCDHGRCKGCIADESITDSQGRYSLERVVRGRSSRLRITALDYATNVFNVLTDRDKQHEERNFEIEQGHLITGTVVDLSTGKALEAVEIEDRGVTGLDLGRTDRDGRFRVRALSSALHERVLLSLTTKGYCRLQGSFRTSELVQNSHLSVRMPRAVPIQGIVKNAKGEGIEGVSVSSTPISSQQWLGAGAAKTPRVDPLNVLGKTWVVFREGRGEQVKTDVNGRYRTLGLVPWSDGALLRFDHKDYIEAQQTIREMPRPGQLAEVDVTLVAKGPVGTLFGKLRFNGRPMRASVWWKGRTRSGSEYFDRTGQYRVEVEAGQVQVIVRKLDIGYSDPTEPGSISRTVSVGAGQEVELDFLLKTAMVKISGHVRGADGSPRDGQWVIARAEKSREVFRAKSDGDGAYAVEVPSNMGSFSVSTRAGLASITKDAVLGGQSGVNFVLPSLGTVEIQVLDDASGQPLEPWNYKIMWRKQGDRAWKRLRQQHLAPRTGESRIDLEPGACDLELRMARGAHEPWMMRGLVIKEGRRNKKISVRLKKGARITFKAPPDQAELPNDALVLVLEPELVDKVKVKRTPKGGVAVSGIDMFLSDRRRVAFRGGRVKEVAGLAPGRYLIRCFGADLLMEPAEVAVRRGESREVLLRWRPK